MTANRVRVTRPPWAVISARALGVEAGTKEGGVWSGIVILAVNRLLMQHCSIWWRAVEPSLFLEKQ